MSSAYTTRTIFAGILGRGAPTQLEPTPRLALRTQLLHTYIHILSPYFYNAQSSVTFFAVTGTLLRSA